MKTVLVSAVVALLVVLVAHFVLPANSLPQTAAKESVYDRVMRTGTIRCGYNTEPPFVVIDPNTRKVSGAGVDIVEEMGKLLGLKVEWAEQVGWDMMAAGLQNGRYDLACNGKWVLAHRLNGDDILTSTDLPGAAANHQSGSVIPLGSRGRWNAPWAPVGGMSPTPTIWRVTFYQYR